MDKGDFLRRTESYTDGTYEVPQLAICNRPWGAGDMVQRIHGSITPSKARPGSQSSGVHRQEETTVPVLRGGVSVLSVLGSHLIGQHAPESGSY